MVDDYVYIYDIFSSVFSTFTLGGDIKDRYEIDETCKGKIKMSADGKLYNIVNYFFYLLYLYTFFFISTRSTRTTIHNNIVFAHFYVPKIF